MVVLAVKLLLGPDFVKVIVVKHTVSFLPLGRDLHDLFFKNISRKDQMKKFDECLPILEQIFVVGYHLVVLQLWLLLQLLGRLKLLGFLEQYAQ